MKISTKLRPEELPAHIGEKIKNLTELTGGQNAGILIHDEQVIVCDWSEAEGLPYVTFSYDLIFTDGDDITLTGVKYIEDVREALPGTMEYDPQRKDAPQQRHGYSERHHRRYPGAFRLPRERRPAA